MFPGGGPLAYFSGRAAAGVFLLFVAIAVYGVISATAVAIWSEICATAGAVSGWLGWH
jgi:hypothetical protein